MKKTTSKFYQRVPMLPTMFIWATVLEIKTTMTEQRNCKYTYNITVAGVNTKIIVEAKKESGADQPGAEGVVLEYGSDR